MGAQITTWQRSRFMVEGLITASISSDGAESTVAALVAAITEADRQHPWRSPEAGGAAVPSIASMDEAVIEQRGWHSECRIIIHPATHLGAPHLPAYHRYVAGLAQAVAEQELDGIIWVDGETRCETTQQVYLWMVGTAKRSTGEPIPTATQLRELLRDDPSQVVFEAQPENPITSARAIELLGGPADSLLSGRFTGDQIPERVYLIVEGDHHPTRNQRYNTLVQRTSRGTLRVGV